MTLSRPLADPVDSINAFIERWAASEAAERASFPLFAAELCDLLGVARPQGATADPERDRYCFEYAVKQANGDGTYSTRRIDLYRKGCFVMEAKQGSNQRDAQLPLFGETAPAGRKGTAVRGTNAWTAAMQRARHQAEDYAKAVPVGHGWPPFIIVVDVGHCFELYADFSLSGKNYAQFPDAQSFRVPLAGLRDPAIRARLAAIWTAPQSLDPAAVGAN